MRHGPPGRGADEKPKNIKSSMLELLRYLKPWYKPIVISLIFSLVGTLLTIIAPDKLADLTNNISDGLQTGIDMDLIIKSILIIPRDIHKRKPCHLRGKLYHDNRHAEACVEHAHEHKPEDK